MYEILEHKADIGIKGIGKTKEKAFEEAAKAMYSLMANIKKINAKEKKTIKVKAETLEELLYVFLNELIFITNTKQLLFSKFKVKIKEKQKKIFLECIALGEKINEKKHEIYADVKAATFSGLKTEKKDKKFIAQCILDV